MVPQTAWILNSFWTSYFQIWFKSIPRCSHLSSWSKSYSSRHTITVSIPNWCLLAYSHKIWLTLQISTRWLLSFSLIITIYYKSNSFSSSVHSNYDPSGGPCAQDPHDYWVDFLRLVVIPKKNNNKHQEKSPQRSWRLAKVRAIISLRSFSFVGFHHFPCHSISRPREGISMIIPSTLPKFNSKIKDQFNIQDDQTSNKWCNSMSTLHFNIQVDRFKIDV